MQQASVTFFQQALTSAISAALGPLAGDAVNDILDVLLGGGDPPSVSSVLSQVSQQIDSIQNAISSLPELLQYDNTTSTYTSNVETITTTLNNVNAALPGDLAASDINNLLSFINPADRGTMPSYRLQIEDLLLATYGCTLEEITAGQTASSTGVYLLGTSTSYAQTIQAGLFASASTTDAFGCINAQMQLSAFLTTMVTTLAYLANQCYLFLADPVNQEAINLADLPLNCTISSALTNAEMLADISNMASPTFIPTLISPSLINAPAGLCGQQVFSLITALSYNFNNQAAPIPYPFFLSSQGNYLMQNGNFTFWVGIQCGFTTNVGDATQWQLQPVPQLAINQFYLTCDPSLCFSTVSDLTIGGTLIYSALFPLSQPNNPEITKIIFNLQLAVNSDSSTNDLIPLWLFLTDYNDTGALANENSDYLLESFDASNTSQQWVINAQASSNNN